ncbi:MAG: phenylalanine--tRNA ligase subunit beta [Bdellovibrionaceae bacterium]|nr:phenylalanine--tRNA ligase subunit beta [Pseudobdellovibrionaceae bacterium]
MKISLKWLNELIAIDEYIKKPEPLAEILTKAGLEIEAIENKAKNFENVVVGLILEKDKHPNADKLSLCRVTTGNGVVHQIVCGAKNHKAGDRVVVALPGAILPGNFAIQKSVIRSVESYGMLCSLKELGLPGDSEGLLILPETATVGKDFAEYYGQDDVVFEIKVTPNRADVLSHFGLARELSCLLSRPLKEIKIDEGHFKKDKSTKKTVSLVVEDASLCPRYTAAYIANVNVQPSPEWLVRRLESVGINSINNIVDITNYILQELGQPLHAFDADEILDKKIVVGHPEKNAAFVTLDGTELKLSGDELSIKNAKNETLCLAGLIGGKNSGVKDSTQNIFLESAYFISHSVRKSSRTLGVETESGYRFARGVDPDLSLYALKRAADLIHQLGSGEVYADFYDVYPNPIRREPISITLETVTDRLGYEANAGVFENWMMRLNCKVEKIKEGSYLVTPPTFRFDMEHEMDLVEEYARLQGYDLIPESLPSLTYRPLAHDAKYLQLSPISLALSGLGFDEAFNYSFVSKKDEDLFFGDIEKLSQMGLRVSSERVALRNPLNEDLNIMRSTLTLGLVKNAINNVKYGNNRGALFEVGKTFSKNNGTIVEKNSLGLVMWGKETDHWTAQSQVANVFHVKEAVQVLAKVFGLKAYSWEQKADNGGFVPTCFHPYQTAVLIVEGKKCGFISSLSPLVLENEKIREAMCVAELDLDVFLPQVARPVRIKDIARYPVVDRDLALVMKKSQAVGDVLKVVRKTVGACLFDLEVFDIYEGEKLPHGQKSIALRIRYQDPAAALADAAIQTFQDQILKSLSNDFGITLR